jgi:hypothetical protein
MALIQKLALGLAILVCSVPYALFSQVFGNEWIDYGQQYWKFQVTEDGVYSISYSDLSNGGFPVGSIDPRNIQIFGRGKQIPVKVYGEEDGVFNTEDKIEFFARRNDGWLDSLVYTDSDLVSNPGYSLFNDTISYFITVGDQTGLRTLYVLSSNYWDFTTEDYCLKKAVKYYHNEYLIGRQDGSGVSLPTYDKAEGWFDFKFPKGTSHLTEIITPNAYTGANAPAAKVHCISASASLASGFPNHHISVGWGEPMQVAVDSVYYGYQLNKFDFEVPAQQITSTTKITHQSVDDLGVLSDYHAVSYVSIEYPRNFNFSGLDYFEFRVKHPENGDIAHLSIGGVFPGNWRLFVLSDGIAKEIQLIEESGIYHALISFESQQWGQNLLFIEQNNVNAINPIQPINNTGYFIDYSQNELDSAFVIITHPSLMAACQNYASYRDNNGMSVLLVSVEELYMQYASGIEKHPLAIRNFCNQLLTAWNSDPQYLFIIGKSIHEMTVSATIGARNDPIKYQNNLVPTWGYPGSDIVFTSGLGTTLYESAIPTGRLAAQSSAQVLEYLNKVIEHESASPAMWQKNILHFGGGGNEFEQSTFRNYLNDYRHIAEDTCLGGSVHSFFKNTLEPVQINVSDSIQLLINEGVSLMTFFGHASSTGFDQNIDTPESYTNQGKYPLLIGNSCYTGNIHLADANSTSENFVLVPNRGVIGFLAKSDLGIPAYLDLYTENFYREIFNLHYGSSIGQCMNFAINDFQLEGDFYRTNVALTFALHGDPSIKLHPWAAPDYSISQADVFSLPSQINATDPSFQIGVVVQNLAKAINDDVGIELVRHFPNGVDSSYLVVVDRILNNDTIYFTLPTGGEAAIGQNYFDVFADYPANLVGELHDVTNNIVQQKEILINSGNLVPVWPYEFAVIDDIQPKLKASTGFAFEEQQTYIFQADTTDQFNSPWMQQTMLTQGGGVVEWQLPISLTDSLVVFWRCSPDSINAGDNYYWKNSSFQYISNETGWGQDHFFQFDKNEIQGLQYNRPDRNWTFVPIEANLKCEVYGNANTSFEALGTRYQIDLDVQDYSGYGYDMPALMVAVLDGNTFVPWESNYNGSHPDHEFGNTLASANARGRPERYFIFQQNDAQQLQGFADMLQNEIQDGDFLLVYTWQYAQKANWQSLAPDVFDSFETIGTSQITTMNDSLPFILFMKYGSPSTLNIQVGSSIDDHLVLEQAMEGTDGGGLLISPVIGPSDYWGKLEWNTESIGNAEGDTLNLKLYGINNFDSRINLAQWGTNAGSINNLESVISSASFPYLQLEAEVTDSTLLTPPQLDRWHVLFDEAPELAVNANKGYYLSNDTLQEAEIVLFAVAVENISPYPFDSLTVHYTLEDANHVIHVLPYEKQSPLLPGQILLDTISIQTTGFAGLNSLRIDANPVDNATGLSVLPEKYHFNNLAEIDFLVEGDRLNPILDVSFDGQHIMNGDIVSPNPQILITVDDENQYLILNEISDTSRFRVYLTAPDGNIRQVRFADNDMSWTPASAPQNKFKINFNPSLGEDGLYRLKVQGADKSGNLSGDQDYEIDFEVITRPGITQVMNYPNPFSTRTQFVFTLTGSEVPEEFKIQIMSIGGDIVREITRSELGDIHVGRNLTEYWWDGKDEYGDQLANGLYVYRVIARLHGENLEIRPSGADKWFNKGWGKLYIMR